MRFAPDYPDNNQIHTIRSHIKLLLLFHSNIKDELRINTKKNKINHNNNRI